MLRIHLGLWLTVLAVLVNVSYLKRFYVNIDPALEKLWSVEWLSLGKPITTYVCRPRERIGDAIDIARHFILWWISQKILRWSWRKRSKSLLVNMSDIIRRKLLFRYNRHFHTVSLITQLESTATWKTWTGLHTSSNKAIALKLAYRW